MKITKLDAASMSVNRWSGGTTTQLAIYPPSAVYADRDFLWRLSSAVVELPESDFTPLPDYDRILMILDGELFLSHDGGTEYLLQPLEQTSFDGASSTFSRGQVTDFNLMMRKGKCTGQVRATRLNAGEAWNDTLCADFDTTLYYCASGAVTISLPDGHVTQLCAGDALKLDEICCDEIKFEGDAVIIRADTNIR